MAQTVNDEPRSASWRPFQKRRVGILHRARFFSREVHAGGRRLAGSQAGTVKQWVGATDRRACHRNQPHRCEVAKMMVSPKAARKGVGRATDAASTPRRAPRARRW